MENFILKNDKENDPDNNIDNDINYDTGNDIDYENECQNEEMLDIDENNELLISDEELKELKEEYYNSVKSNLRKKDMTLLFIIIITIVSLIAIILCHYF